MQALCRWGRVPGLLKSPIIHRYLAVGEEEKYKTATYLQAAKVLRHTGQTYLGHAGASTAAVQPAATVNFKPEAKWMKIIAVLSTQERLDGNKPDT